MSDFSIRDSKLMSEDNSFHYLVIQVINRVSQVWDWGETSFVTQKDQDKEISLNPIS